MKGHVPRCNQNHKAPGENSNRIAFAGPQKKEKWLNMALE
jgi:hypothetical protein